MLDARRAEPVGEVAFLRAEVHNLEHVIGAARRAYEEDTARQAVVVRRAEQEILATRQSNSKLQEQVASLSEQIRVLHAQQADACAAAGLQAAEAVALQSGLQLLRAELTGEERERHEARELEACALSVASTYREFALQGAAQLKSMESDLQAVGSSLEARLARLGASTAAALRQSALRVLLGAAASRLCEAALRRWAACVVQARAAESDVVRISAAVRRETQRKAARTNALEKQCRSERAAAAEALGQARAQVKSLQREVARLEAAGAGSRGEQRPLDAGDGAATSRSTMSAPG
jgi:hypothetical protein